ncbi:nuclear transport factor 2 family protein [Bowmanella dokdonensis]|uniref:Nuclear transport factor 2 family protein n=1 Tax=Bowmanella dokdonensis TaxID=751969 RepID=A0A939DQS9_9ALTE|nr:nuclear transport factor 2 family protein [Bowmanella dokdonensis]MBN7827253.1 nuclear transport factor 2 family protein [Bowmanella dokdonensis]
MRFLILMLSLLAACFPAFAGPPEVENEQIVRDFLAAFNEHNSAAMAELVTADVQWLSIDGEALLVEAKGKAALVESMDSYFSSCASCRSRITELTVLKDRISAVEVASWQSREGLQQQRALCVYEFSGGLIRRVYYFPDE